MDSYKKWKTLNENLGPGAFTLGLGQPTNLGLSSPFPTFTDVMTEKKKSIKVDVEGDDDDMDDLGDEDGVIADEGCGCGSKSGKKSGKKSAKKSAKASSKKSAKHMDSDMGGDFEDDDGEDHDDHDDEGDDEGDHDEPDGDEDELGDEGDHDEPEEGGDEAPMFSKKKSGKKSGKKSAKKSEKKSAKKSEKKSEKKMHKEGQNWWQQDDADWMKSVQSMLGAKTDTKYKDGWSEYQEDALLPTPAPNGGADGAVEPQPGEPGFAPSGRLDVGFDSSMSLGEAVKVIEEACGKAGPKLQRKLIKKLAQLHNKLL